jgi:tetratricopeptide (TPR) repeat protein
MVALVFGLVLACYWPALHGGLVWDDEGHVTRPDLRSWAGLGRIWFEVRATQQYYPVLHSAFWMEHRLWGDATLGYHLINVLLHAASCCLLALVLQRLLDGQRAQQACAPTGKIDGNAAGRGAGAPVRQAQGPEPAEGPCPSLASPCASGAWLAALLFAVHPVCVESVAWISEQKNTLSLVFYLLAALAYFEFADRRSGWAYGRALAFFLLALGTKSMTATLPAALLVVLWWRNGRLDWRRDIVPLIPWFVAAAAAGLLTAWVERRLIGAEGGAFDLSAGQRCLLAGRVVWFYLGKLGWPADLMFIYPRWDVPAAAAGWYGWGGGVLAITAGLWMIRRRSRGPLAGWLFFVGSLFPALGFFNVYPFIFSYVADHFQYLASLGIIAIAAAGIALVLARVPSRARAGGRILCALLVAGLAVLTNLQSRTYRDSETLYRTTLDRNPACWMAHNNLAAEIVKSPARVPEALIHYEAALRLRPNNAEAHNNLANELVKLPGRMPEALVHFERALQLNPAFFEAHLNLANALAKLPDRMPETLAHYREALRLDPHNPEAHFCLANTLATRPNGTAAAQAEFDEALRLRPGYAEAHANLAGLLAKQPSRLAEALAHYVEALRLAPSLAKTHFNLAAVLETVPGREAEALTHYREALRLDPGYAEAHNNLAVLCARAGRLEEARQHWETAVKLKPEYEEPRKNLDLLQRMSRP